MSFNAQELNQRITVQEAVEAQDPMTGEITVTWETFATLWAKAEPAVGREFEAAAAIQAERPVKFTCRWQDDIEPTMRIVWRGDIYNIRSIADVKGKRREMLIYAQGGVNDG